MNELLLVLGLLLALWIVVSLLVVLTINRLKKENARLWELLDDVRESRDILLIQVETFREASWKKEK
jgi:hypothetical protein